MNPNAFFFLPLWNFHFNFSKGSEFLSEATVFSAASPSLSPESGGPLLHVIHSLSASSCPVFLH